MKICGMSDMHGQYNFEVKPCDIVLICGDLVPLDIQKNDDKSEEWFKDFFIPWCNSLPCEKVVFIGGNHDFFLRNHPDRMRMMLQNELTTKHVEKIIYLECTTFEYQGKVIYGTPVCKRFGSWAFMKDYGQQKECYERHLKAIGKIDIIMCHDCPYGISDVLLQKDCWWADGKHIGNRALRWFVDEAKPELLLEGHLHSCNHNKVMHDGTAVYNVSLLDEDYKMSYEPLYLEI